MDHVKGDKVVWIIVLLLMLLSVVFIFSSSYRLTTDEISRLDIVKDQLLVMLIGLVLLLLTYFFIGPDFLRKWSWLGFVLSFLRSVTCLSVVIFLYAPETTVGKISVMVLVQSGQYGEAAAFTIVLITIAFTVLKLAQWILGKQGIKLEL